ncbi:MAG TPA: hypothetical protein VKY85_12430 [Candidatus Angelobacter sp.]|nr:hypothetical protein [Candidatus Angelobacter sp.]
MRYPVIRLLALVTVLPLAAQDASTHAHHQQSMEQRGNQGMGFDQQKTTHHFLLTKNGGVIQVNSNSADDKTSADEIKMHLRHIAKAFASGDFDIPMFVHDQTPPGVTALKRLRKKIQYRVESTDSGGQVVITTTNPEAQRAIWDFLRFQITEHKTGDSLVLP